MDRVWTADLVKQELVKAFREGMYRAVRSSPGGGLAYEHAVEGRHLTGLELIDITAHFLGRKKAGPDPRLALLVWARAKAGGIPFAEACETEGWARSSADRAKDEAARLVALGLNAVAREAIILPQRYEMLIVPPAALDCEETPAGA